GYKGGKIRISHCCNESSAQKLKELIQAEFKKAKIEIGKTRGLCSYYAEKGGLLIGFEKNLCTT
ncbi:MAG: fatty acid-binding protein DegV, partial [Peptococcaceae bacterium]|nr:fatty acid-binding protein DegV [Peptococcaceae bacterium]